MDLKKLIKEVLSKQDCGCGCGKAKCFEAPILNENIAPRNILSEGLQYHIDTKKPLYETTLSYGSPEYINLWAEARYLYLREAIDLTGVDLERITETDLGEYGMFEGQLVPLDMPMLDEEENVSYKPNFDEQTLFSNLFTWVGGDLSKWGVNNANDLMHKFRKEPSDIMHILSNVKGQDIPSAYKKALEYYKSQTNISEAEYQGRKVQLGKPMQGDSKKFKVYVKNDKGKVVKVNFGFGGKSAKGKRMVIKAKNPKARSAYRARHHCDNPGPRWKANYWSCKKW